MKNQGLTLLEVMVALAIFAMTGTAVMKAASDHLSAVSQLEEMTIATWVANNRLTQLQIKSQWPPKDNRKGSVEMAGRTWYWQQSVLKTNDDELRAVEVSVGLDDSYQQRITSVTSYLSRSGS